MEIYYDEGFAVDFYKKFNLKKAVLERGDGSYAGDRTYIGKNYDEIFAALVGHLNGDRTLGFSVVHRNKASFLCLDIDAHFEQRKTTVFDVLKRFKMLDATCYTNGSKPDKGKVFVVLNRGIIQGRAIQLITDIFEQCKDAKGFTIETEPIKVDVFPTNGSGGLVRIGGQRHKPEYTGPVETFYLPNGHILADFDRVKPYKEPRVCARMFAPMEPASWVSKRLERGFERAELHNDIRKKIVALAFQSLFTNHPTETMTTWLEQLQLSSCDIMEAEDSTKSKLLSAGLAPQYVNYAYNSKERQNNWSAIAFWPVQSRRSKFKSYAVCEKFPTRDDIFQYGIHNATEILARGSVGAVRVYKKLVDYTRVKNCNRKSFCIDTETIADYCGISKSQCKRDLQAAEKTNIIIVLERGTFLSRKSTRYSLRSHPEFIDFVKNSAAYR